MQETISIADFGAFPANRDNTTAIQAAVDASLANPAGVIPITCPAGVYKTHTITIGHVDIDGRQIQPIISGAPCTWQSISAEPLFFSTGGLGLNVAHMTFDCNHVGTYGFLLSGPPAPAAPSTSVAAVVTDIVAKNCTTAAITLDAVANSQFNQVTALASSIGLKVVNGAATNQLNKLEVDDSTGPEGMFIGRDTTLNGDRMFHGTFITQSNHFDTGLIEFNGGIGASAPINLLIDNGIDNIFTNWGFVPNPATTSLIVLNANAANNKFVNSATNNVGIDTTHITNKGFYNAFINSNMLITGACTAQVIKSSGGYLALFDMAMNASTPCLKISDTGPNSVAFSYLDKMGPTSLRNNPPPIAGIPFYDTSIKRQLWTNAAGKYVDYYGNPAANGAKLWSGTGSPAGVVNGQKGDIYQNITGASSGGSVYVNRTGGADGWSGLNDGHAVNALSSGEQALTRAMVNLPLSIPLDLDGTWKITMGVDLSVAAKEPVTISVDLVPSAKLAFGLNAGTSSATLRTPGTLVFLYVKNTGNKVILNATGMAAAESAPGASTFKGGYLIAELIQPK